MLGRVEKELLFEADACHERTWLYELSPKYLLQRGVFEGCFNVELYEQIQMTTQLAHRDQVESTSVFASISINQNGSCSGTQIHSLHLQSTICPCQVPLHSAFANSLHIDPIDPMNRNFPWRLNASCLLEGGLRCDTRRVQDETRVILLHPWL